MSFAKPLTRLSAIIRAPVMSHPDRSTDSEWFLPYDGPVEPPPPVRHPFASDIPQPKPIRPTPKPEPRERDEVRGRSRSRSRDAKRKSQRSYQALDAGGGVGAYPGPDHVSVHSDHTLGHVRARSAGLGVIDPKYTFPWPDDSTVSSGKHSDPPLMLANHPFRMHTASPPPRSHTAAGSTSTPWVQTIVASPGPPDPAPMRKRRLTYQPGLVTSFGSGAESRVGYRESGAFDLDDREREKIRPTLLPPSLSLLGRQYDLGSHPYAATTGPVRETRFGSVSTTTTTTTGTGKPPIPPRPNGLKLKSSLKASVSTPELRIRIPSTVPSLSRTPDIEPQVVGSRPIPRSAPGPTSTGSGSGPAATLEARTICDALIFARPRFRVTAHEITPPPSPEGNRASVLVGESGFKGLVCLPRKKPSRDSVKLKEKASRDSVKVREKASRESVKPKEDPKFKTLEDVLRDGAQLEKEREEWNAIGQGGLLNNRARSLSRSYSKAGGARVGGARPRRETQSTGTDEGKAAWGTLKLKRSVEMFGALALAQGKGHAPTPSVSSRRHGTQRSVSATTATSHVRGASTSTHSRAESWGQRIACSASSVDDLGQSTEGLLHARRPAPEDYPVVDIRPVPARNANRARAPARPSRSPGPSNALLQPPTPEGSVIGLALSTPTASTLVLHNHPFAQRAGAFPATPLPASAGPETVASRHRHPPRSSGSTERAMLNLGAAERTPVSGMVSRSAPPAVAEHPFVARQSIVGPSGAVQQMFENAMLNSAGGEQAFDLPEVDRRPSPELPRRGSGDSGIGSSVHEHGGSYGRATGLAAVRGSAFGPPSGYENMLPAQSPPELPKTSPYSLTDSLSPASRPGVLTRTSSGMIDPALAGMSTRSHESSSSSFSSPRPLCSIDDIESLRDIFYRPSPIPRVASNSGLRRGQDESPASEPVLSEEDEPESEDEDEFERTERAGEWGFDRSPFELERDSHLIWERRDERDNKPLRISVAPGTPSPPPMPLSRDVPESVHDSDSQSERSVGTTSSQRVTNENITFGTVPSAHPIDALSVDPASYRQSTALSLIDMYDYDISISSSSPNTPQNHQGLPFPFDRPSTLHSNPSETYPRESYYTVSTAASRPGMDHLISGFPTPPVESVSPISSSVLSSYFTVDSPSTHRREDDEYR